MGKEEEKEKNKEKRAFSGLCFSRGALRRVPVNPCRLGVRQSRCASTRGLGKDALVRQLNAALHLKVKTGAQTPAVRRWDLAWDPGAKHVPGTEAPGTPAPPI